MVGPVVTGSELTWPGVDRDRAVTACWHLERAVVHLAAFRSLSELEEAPPWVAPAAARLAMAGEHVRLARGYLGAIGFERGGRLFRRSAPA